MCKLLIILKMKDNFCFFRFQILICELGCGEHCEVKKENMTLKINEKIIQHYSPVHNNNYCQNYISITILKADL